MDEGCDECLVLIAGDVNTTDTLTAADIIGEVNYVFKGGPAPCDVCSLIPVDWSCP